MRNSPWVHEYTATIAAPRSAVFAALTEADQLRRWYADEVNIDPTPGRPWQFWGRHILGTPKVPATGDRLLELEAPSHLRYSWLLEDCPTEVRLRLVEQESDGKTSTSVTVHHALSHALPHPRPVELVDDFWRLALGNLAAHLAGGSGIVRPDFADPTPEIRLSIVIEAPPSAVFHALMDPEALRQWVGATAPVVEPRVGGAYRFGWKYPVEGREVTGGPVTILELVPDQLLVTDWPDWRGDPAVPMQRIEWHLEPVEQGTRVTIVHAGFRRAADLSDYPFGWGDFSAALKAFVEAT